MRRRRLLGLASVAALAALAALAGSHGCSNAVDAGASPAADAAGDATSLLLVTLDTTRADRLGCYGWTAARTPTIDALARDGVVYARTWCTAPITLSSHVTILTGAYPCAHGVRENGAFALNRDARLLPEALKEAGFRTGAFVGTFVLDPKFGLDQGFEVYDAPLAANVGQVWGVISRAAGEVTEAALRFIDTIEPGQRFFLWVHYYDPHHAYAPPAPFLEGGADPYDGEIAYCDSELARVLARLRERGLDRGLLTAVTADHGEALGDHGEKTHGTFVYEAMMRVPLIVSPPPAGVAPGARVTAPVSTADLAATLLERLGIGREALPAARTPLLPRLDSDVTGEDERALYLESLTPFYTYRQAPIRAVLWKGMKYVETVRPELYSLADDPGESVDLAGVRADVRDGMANRLHALLREHAALPWSGQQASLPAHEQQLLAAAGYTVGGASGNPFETEDLPDPKDCVHHFELHDQIVTAVRDGSKMLEAAGRPGIPIEKAVELKDLARARLTEARALIATLRAENPRDPLIVMMLGPTELGLGNYFHAAALFEELLAVSPNDVSSRYSLAIAYQKGGRPKWARREMEKAAHVEPRSLLVLRWLVEFTILTKDFPAAAWWLDRLAECPGQNEESLAEVAKTRAGVQKKLDELGASPQPPAPVDDLTPEGVRDRNAANQATDPGTDQGTERGK